MSRLEPNRLSARKVETIKSGSYADGGNLWFTAAGGSRVFSLRYTSPTTGKRREMGLGPFPDVSLARARELATDARRQLLDGIDPIDARKQARAARKGMTFKEAAEAFIADKKAGWRDSRGEEIWASSMVRLVYPSMGERPVNAVGTDDVLGVLRPIWSATTETATRVRGRIERVLDYASTHGWRTGDNPARWRGHLENILAKPTAVGRAGHFGAVPWKDISRVMARLAASTGMSALAVRFACLTAARPSEARKVVWAEIDLSAALWVVPADRMKSGKEHRVPLSQPALTVLEQAVAAGGRNGLVFPGAKLGQPLSDVALSKALHTAAGSKAVTVHGLRSTFRDWTAEATEVQTEVAEMALAHIVANKVEAAYRRGDLFAKRRELMDAWGSFTTAPASLERQ